MVVLACPAHVAAECGLITIKSDILGQLSFKKYVCAQYQRTVMNNGAFRVPGISSADIKQC